MYGSEDRIPPVSPAIMRDHRLQTPLSGDGLILQDAALYFVPGKYKQEVESAFTRTARLIIGEDIYSEGRGDTPVALTQARDNSGRGDTPVSQSLASLISSPAGGAEDFVTERLAGLASNTNAWIVDQGWLADEGWVAGDLTRASNASLREADSSPLNTDY